jgi:DNA-binding HxlR family transcriptional regulator
MGLHAAIQAENVVMTANRVSGALHAQAKPLCEVPFCTPSCYHFSSNYPGRYEKYSMKFPQPGQSVRGSRTGHPTMALLDLLGRRMSLRVLWELAHAAQPLTFRQLQGAAETNPSLLNTRLKELRAAAIVVHDTGGYGLSAEGKALVHLIMPLDEWAAAWGARLGAEDGAEAAMQNARERDRPLPPA